MQTPKNMQKHAGMQQKTCKTAQKHAKKMLTKLNRYHRCKKLAQTAFLDESDDVVT